MIEHPHELKEVLIEENAVKWFQSLAVPEHVCLHLRRGVFQALDLKEDLFHGRFHFFVAQ
jgi:hypothetical protein